MRSSLVKSSLVCGGILLVTCGRVAGQECAVRIGSSYSRAVGVSIVWSANFPNPTAISFAADAWNNGCSTAGIDYPWLLVGEGYPDQLFITWQVGQATTKNCLGGTEYCQAEWNPVTRDLTVYSLYGPDGTTETPTSTELLGLLIQHEFGHAVGLGHDTCTNGIMNTPIPLGSVITASECRVMDWANRLPGEPTDDCYDPPLCEFSPVVVNLGQGPYVLTGLEDPVRFDINADGRLDEIGWTGRRTQLAFLWLDRNRNGVVDDGAELFGTVLGPNGFEVLARFDRRADGDLYFGGNGDGVIDAADEIWRHLRVWVDVNHDGVSSADEIGYLSAGDFVGIRLNYRSVGRRDSHGNQFRFTSMALRRGPGGQVHENPIYEIWFVGR